MNYKTAVVVGGFTREQEATFATDSFMVADLRRQLDESKDNEKNYIEEMVRQKKMKAEIIKDFKSLESDLRKESKKRKASEEAAEKELKKRKVCEAAVEEEKRKRLIAEAETKDELKKRRIAEEEFRKKRIALAAEKEINFRLETMLTTRPYRIDEGRGSSSKEGKGRESLAMESVSMGLSEQQHRSMTAAPEGHSLEEGRGSTFIPGRQGEGQVRGMAAVSEHRALEERRGGALVTIGHGEEQGNSTADSALVTMGQWEGQVRGTAAATEGCALEEGRGGPLGILGHGEQQGRSTVAASKKRTMEKGKVEQGKLGSAELGQGEVGRAEVGQAEVGDGMLVQGMLVQGELVQGKLVQGELVQGELVQGKLVQGELVKGELVQGELVKGELVQSKLVQAELVQGELEQGEVWQGWSNGAYICATDSVTLEYEEEDLLPAPKIIRKKRTKTIQPVEEAPPSGPFHLDEEKLKQDYAASPQHINIIKGFPRREEEMFTKSPKNKIPAEKNGKFQAKLYLVNDAIATFEDYNLTKESYRLKYGEEFEPSTHLQAKGPSGTNGRGLDTVASSVRSVKSSSWLQGFTWVYNQMVAFVLDKPEFRNFDWLSATASEFDVILGHFWLWLGPLENGGSLGGHRYTTDSLKQIKTKIVNLTQLMMKRTDININSPAMRFSRSMMEMKRNKTAEEPLKQNAGARKRVALEEEDRVKMDKWMTKPVHKVRTVFPKHPHVVCLPCHPFTMPSVHHVFLSPCHSFTICSIQHVNQSPCHPVTLSSIHHIIHSPCHQLTMLFIHHISQ